MSKTVLILPHSNAGEERVVSLIRKNKTAIGSISPGGRYVGLFAYYQNGKSSFEPPADLLATVKKATWNFN